MKIIVLGAGGMLGHLAGCFFKEKYPSRVVCAARRKTGYPAIDEDLEIIDLCDHNRLRDLIQRHRPCTVINCAAVNDSQKDAQLLQEINARLPRQIAVELGALKDGSRLIHVSTDGVFRGDKGRYDEEALPDAEDVYGKSKRDGEVTRAPHLTVRTSIVGPDPINGRGLMSWLLSQKSDIQGFSNVFWSGVTTLELARFMDFAVAGNISGLCHLTSSRISKYDLLCLMKDVFGLTMTIAKEGQTFLDRSLTTRRFDILYRTPGHRQMLMDLKEWMKVHPSIYVK